MRQADVQHGRRHLQQGRSSTAGTDACHVDGIYQAWKPADAPKAACRNLKGSMQAQLMQH